MRIQSLDLHTLRNAVATCALGVVFFAVVPAALADEFDPTEVLIVVDAMTGQEAVTLARDIDEAIEGTGIVVSKVDSDTRGGAVLSVREVTGLPIKFITTGERLEALETFHPDRFASRVLGMGDVVSLVERAKEIVPERDAKEMARRARTGPPVNRTGTRRPCKQAKTLMQAMTTGKGAGQLGRLLGM